MQPDCGKFSTGERERERETAAARPDLVCFRILITMSDLFTEITENRTYHYETNYDAIDSIESHLQEGWNWCDNKQDYEGFNIDDENKIPLSYTKEWCENCDFIAEQKQISVDILLG